MNGADLAVLVVPFLDGSSNRVEAGTDLEVHVDAVICQVDFLMFFLFLIMFVELHLIAPKIVVRICRIRYNDR